MMPTRRYRVTEPQLRPDCRSLITPCGRRRVPFIQANTYEHLQCYQKHIHLPRT